MTFLSATIIDAVAISVDGSRHFASDAPASVWPRDPPFRGMSAAPNIWKDAREIGLARARSASPAAWLSICAAGAIRHLVAAGRTTVSVVSTTATQSVAVRFEQGGLRDGWRLTDPFWLPNTIPSGTATAVVSTLGLSGTAIGYPGTIQGVFAALDQSMVHLTQQNYDNALIIIAEDNSWIRPILSNRGIIEPTRSGAIAIVLGLECASTPVVRRRIQHCSIEETQGGEATSRTITIPALPHEADVLADLLFACRVNNKACLTDYQFLSGNEKFTVSVGTPQ